MKIAKVYTDEIREFVQEYLDSDPFKLFLALKGKANVDLKMAVDQIQSRQKARKKLPNWSHNFSLFFPEGISVEQASSEETAQFKIDLVHGHSMIDLTGGFGVDTYFLSRNFKKVTYCERDGDLVDIFRYNMEVLGEEKFETFYGDSLQILSDSDRTFDLIFVDPARRGDRNQKLYRLSDCEPDLVSNWELLKGKGDSILVKTSPMLDLKQAILEIPDIQNIWVISVKNEVKEVLLFWEKNKKIKTRMIHCVDLSPTGKQEFNFSFEQEELAVNKYSEVKSYIIEPLAVILKAGAFKTFGQNFGLDKLHPNSHLYTSDTVHTDIPGRIFEVIREFNQPKKELKESFPSGKVNVIARNFTLSADEIKSKFRLKDGGDDFLIATKVGDRYRVFYCKRI
ncbi:class I SAM-dependent methyltransferase [Shivajiella indica]|uniref:RsmD family RNA methyltransferase n=1 Tax=Shivajiella indica TaxID=872115 RepID=A0ABW5B283_9BACT